MIRLLFFLISKYHYFLSKKINKLKESFFLEWAKKSRLILWQIFWFWDWSWFFVFIQWFRLCCFIFLNLWCNFSALINIKSLFNKLWNKLWVDLIFQKWYGVLRNTFLLIFYEVQSIKRILLKEIVFQNFYFFLQIIKYFLFI